MKIVLLINSLNRGGAERICVNLANRFAEKKHQVTLLTLSSTQCDFILAPEISLDSLHIPQGLLLRLIYILGPFLLRFKYKPDIVISYMWDCNLVASLYAFLFRKPVILTDHNNPLFSRREHSSFIRMCHKLFFRFSSFMVVLSNGCRNFMIEKLGIPPDNVVLIPNPAQPLPETDSKGLSLPEHFLLAAGRFVPAKGFDRMIRIFSKITTRFPKEKLIICGDGILMEDLRRTAEEYHVQDRVIFPGMLDGLVQFYRKADAFLLTSHYEGQPNVLTEAMSCGCPVIAFDCDYGPSTVISSGKDGILVPQDREDLFEQALTEYLANPSFRERFSGNAKRKMEEFAPEKIYQQWIDLIQEVTGK